MDKKLEKIKAYFHTQNVILVFGLMFLVVLCLYPFFMLLIKILTPENQTGWSLEYVDKTLKGAGVFTAISNTVLVSLATGILSSLMALPLAWLFTRTDLAWAKSWRTWFSLPYAIPPFIGGMAWLFLANPSNGLLNKVMVEVFGFAAINIYSFWGLIWILSCFFYTYVLISLMAAMDRLDPSLEEAARIAGAKPGKVFFQITLPLIKPSLFSGFLLVVLAAASSFGVPALIGNPARIYMLTTKIYTLQRLGSLSGVYQAGVLALFLLLGALIILIANQKILAKSYFKSVSGKTSRPAMIGLGRYQRLVQMGLLGILTVVFLLPLMAIFISALNKVQGHLAWDNLGWQNFKKVLFEIDEVPRAFYNSFILGVGSATVTMLVGLFLAYFQFKTKLKGRQWIDIIAGLPYAAPGSVLALAFILTFSYQFFGLPIALYNTLLLIGMTYVAKYISFAVRTTGDGLAQIDDSLAEAARVAGANWFTTMKTIWLPLLRPALVASWFLVFMPCFSELTMTILLTGPGLETVGTVLFQLQEYADASGGGAAVLAIFVVGLVTLINAVVKISSKGKYGL
jgi:iron(III) transport system permease protein